MHLHRHLLPRSNASSPLDYRPHPMANNSQALDLEGFYREIHGMTKHMRIMNENHARLILHLTANNSPPPLSVSPRRSYCTSDNESQSHHNLDARIDAINIGASAPVTVYALIKQIELPFTKRLPPRTIDSYGDLSRLFVANFMSYRVRFNQAVLEVKDPSDKIVIMALMEGLCLGPLFGSLSKNVLESLSILQSKADKYIATEELTEAKQRRRGKDDHKRKEANTRRSDYKGEERNKRSDRDSRRTNKRHPRTPPSCLELILPPLNAPIIRCSRRSSMKNSSSGLEKSRLILGRGTRTSIVSSTETTGITQKIASS
ncbi:hypothetical protein Acr_12g0002020 [Actinidia rufa]|uniref:HIT domain-containing protein n=1 Tax=Actinidia rufa TaxID=165716 RepID=A0A7J0FG56_9ERIC|nr:hypothetical protein Acr_12g0002020 [Actinidia rufa]